MSFPMGSEEDLERLDGACGRLPIFPLPNAVLLPGALLPLHVFEPRYRELIADVLGRGAPIFAVALLEPGHEGRYLDRPPVRPIAGAGVVIGHERLPDGRYNLVLRGIARVNIEEELPPARAYREVRACILPDPPAGEDLGAMVASLRALCDRIAASSSEIREALSELAHERRPPGAYADVIAAALLVVPEIRRSVLEKTDPAERIRFVVDQVGGLLAEIGGPSVKN